MVTHRFIVRGRVQGVGFRYFALRAARRFGITGTVRNMADGSVEAIAQGSDDAVAGFHAELERGPSYGHVDSVHESLIEGSRAYSGFDVVY